MKQPRLQWPALFIPFVLLNFWPQGAIAQCTTPAGATFTESFGDSSNSCWPGGPTGCNQAWQVQGGTYSIAASPDGAPADTVCANSLSVAANATPARLQTYGTIPRIPAGSTLDLYFMVYVTSAPRNGFNFVQLRNLTRTTNTALAQIVWKNSNGTFLSASSATSSGNTEAIALNAWHSVQLHIDATAQNSYIALDAGTPQIFTASALDMNSLVIYGDTVGSFYIGNMYINAPGYVPVGSPMLVDFAGGVPGAPITADSMNAGSHCVNVPWTMSATPMTDMVFSTDQSHPLHTSVQACGNTYAGDTGTSVRYDMSSAQLATYWFETLSPSVSLGFFYNTTERPTSQTFYCNADIMGGLDYACVHQHGNGSHLQIWLEVNIAPELFGAPIPISPNTWYWITLQYNAGGTHHLRVYETQNWTLIGASDGPSNHGVDMPLRYTFGRSGSSPGRPGTYLYFSNMELDWITGQFPLGPGGGDIPALPAITSADHTTFLAGSSGSFNVTSTGSPTPTLSMTGMLPGGVNFDPATGILSGIPTAGVSGTYPLQITATNDLNAFTQDFTLNINLGQTAKPAFSLASGTYTVAQSVSISDATAGSAIFYTTDGSPATSSSTPFGGPIPISTSSVLNAIAVTPGYLDSAAASATYTLKVPTPTFNPGAGSYGAAQPVTISDTLSGASIYYTTNGTAPSAASAPFTDPVNILNSTTLMSIATFPGWSDSAVATAAYTIQGPPAPTFSPLAGTYGTAQSIMLSDITAGVSIYYTTDGTTPTTASTLYVDPIAVTQNTVVRAIASTGGPSSTTASASYTLRPATPVMNVASGTYPSAQTVMISDSTPGTSIFYTTNGSTPSTASTPYTGPVAITATTTLNAIAAVTGWTNSATGSARYTIQAPASPSFSPGSGTYTTTQSVRISDSTAGASIYYTTNGSTPTTASTLYAGPIAVTQSATLRAIASGGGPSSGSTSATYTLRVATPSLSLGGGTYTSAESITISDSTPGATIYYTTNGSTPTTSSTRYTGPIAVSRSTTIQAIAVLSGWSNSNTTSATYTLRVPTPTFNPAAGTYTGRRSVVISDALAGALIYYTTNGSTPTTSSTLYTGAISVSSSRTVRAIATSSGWSNSLTASASYTIR